MICVVEEAFNIPTIEQTRDFRGLFHVLLGALSPLKGVGPHDIDVGGLIKRVQAGGVHEVIVATNPNVEGEATALYLAQQLRWHKLSAALLLRLPVGGDLGMPIGHDGRRWRGGARSRSSGRLAYVCYIHPS